jgi:tetratricopeptide (TPR) repeat protein
MDKALENYQIAIEKKSDYLGAYVGLSSVYENKKDLNKAIENYLVILSAASNNPEALFNLGRLLYNRREKGDLDNAEKLWLEAVRLQPGYSNALYSLGLLYEAKGDDAKALEYYNKVKEINPDNQNIITKVNDISAPSLEETTTETTQ